MIIAGLFALVSPLFFETESSPERIAGVGGAALTIGFVIVSSYGGTLVDFAEKRFKEYLSIGGCKFGEWTTLPVILTVEVNSISYVSTNTPNGISPTLSGKVTDYNLVMYSNASKPVLSFVYSKRDKAVEYAKRLASNLNAGLILNIP